MKTIILRGYQGSGKTTTIRLVYDILLSRGAKIVVPRTKIMGRDFYSVVRYKGKTIYICSEGDNKNDINSHIGIAISGHIIYTNQNGENVNINVACDIYIGASHFADTTFISKYNPVIIDKTGIKDDICNVKDAIKIIRNI